MSRSRSALFGAIALCLSIGSGGIGSAVTLAAQSGLDVEQRAIESAQRNRAGFGFRADETFVAESFTDTIQFPDNEWGMPLTGAEAAEVARRVQVQQDVDAAAVWASNNAPEYAGAWIDQTAGGRAVFQVSRIEVSTKAGIAARVPDGIDYEVRQVARSWAQLIALQDAVIADQDDLFASGIQVTSTAIHTPSNTVLVGLQDPEPKLEAYLHARFGDGLSFRVDVTAHADACPWSDCLPAKGGIRISSLQIGNVCTTGWMVRVVSASPNYFAIVTAGHCFRAGNDSGEGDDWRHSANGVMNKIGDAEKQTWLENAGADVGLIKLTSIPADRNNFVANSAGTTRIRDVLDVATDDEQQVGEYICRMGGNLSSGRTCGFMTAVNVARQSVISGIGSRTILHQNEAAYDSLGGDSGGPVFVGSEAYGTHTHSTDPPANPRSWFSTVNRAESEYLSRWGVQFLICTTTACGG